MWKRTMMMTLLGLPWITSPVIGSQETPASVIKDPLPDKEFPSALAVVTVPSHGVELDATFYLASGAGPHGAVLLLHGLPGFEQNADLAQSIRRAGWNVLIFHYRGVWGGGGSFSLSSAIEDTAAAVRFLRDHGNALKYRMDPTRIVVIGHSVGGFLAGYQAIRDPDISAVAMISAVNMGKINADPAERLARLKRWDTQLHPVYGVTAKEIFDEAEQHRKDWDYLQWADALQGRSVLLVEADDQNHADMEGLATALRRQSTIVLDHEVMETDHSFSDHRIALQTVVLRWLDRLMVQAPKGKH